MFVARETTVVDMLNRAILELKGGSVINPRLEAERIISDQIGISRAELYVNRDRALTQSDAEIITAALRQRITGRPLQYILGHQQFRHLDLLCREGVLIPRPETELLVDAAIAELKRMGGRRTVVDLGCGTGAIGLSIAHECREVHVCMVDVSQQAIRLSKENTLRSGLRDLVETVYSDIFSEIGRLNGAVDIVVSNPPYICSVELPFLQREVQFEPKLALDGGADGLDYYRKIIEQAPSFLKSGGGLLLEVGMDQAMAVISILGQSGFFADIDSYKDYQDIERIVRAQRI